MQMHTILIVKQVRLKIFHVKSSVRTLVNFQSYFYGLVVHIFTAQDFQTIQHG
jgi:hypothetical protein